MKIKTIDVNAKEWFDKANGNSYFTCKITINFGMKNQKNLFIPFQYGYLDHYKYVAYNELKNLKLIKTDVVVPFVYYRDNKIIVREQIQRGCLKRELNY